MRTWRYRGAPGAIVDTNTMRFDTPAAEWPSVEKTGDLQSTGDSTSPPALMPIAQRDQLHNATETYIDTLENEGRVIDESTASHLY